MTARRTRKATISAAGAAAAALLVTGMAGSASADTGPTAWAPSCRTADLTASLRDAQAGAGNFGQTLTLTNDSYRTCTVRGYPRLSVQDARHRNQAVDVVWGSTYFQRDPGPRTVTLRPGQAATASLSWNAPQGDRSITPSYLKVTAPRGRGDLTVRFTPGAIDAGVLRATALAAQPAPARPLKVSVHRLTDYGPTTGPLHAGDTADVVVSGCEDDTDASVTSNAFVDGSTDLVPSADRPTLQGFPEIADVDGVYYVSAQCPTAGTTATTTVTVE
ncbi:DUF4232 domain-containing protein [Streptomyces sp. NPDC048664]|uniref:DUF4232 domain-containing protein n=1 Tax=Streptomyces sp. NPDC048664 TaxID=3154505 RepID=UPI00342EB6C6